MTVYTVMGAFDFYRYERLQEAYDAAVVADEDHFFFDGTDYDTRFTMYLLEYIKGEFKLQA